MKAPPSHTVGDLNQLVQQAWTWHLDESSDHSQDEIVVFEINMARKTRGQWQPGGVAEDSSTEDNSNRKRNSPPENSLTPNIVHMGRHAKLDNVETQDESLMEVDTTMVATVTPTGDKAELAMDIDVEAALEESIVQKKATSPQARASSENKESTAQTCTTKGTSTSLQQAVAAENNNTEQDSKPVATVTGFEEGKEQDKVATGPKAAPMAAIPLCIEAEGPNYTNLWLQQYPAAYKHLVATPMKWEDIDHKTVHVMRVLAQWKGWNEA
jgi:hypothetical protein